MGSKTDQILDEEMDESKSTAEEVVELLQSLKDNTNSCVQMASNLLFRLKDNQMPTKNGNSLVELKNKIFVSYLMDLTFLVWNKISGKRLEGMDVINRLVENRTVLERMKPIEQKLKYSFDKLIKTSTDGTVDPNDPLRFKPKLNTIIGSKDQNSGEEEEVEPEDEEIDSSDNGLGLEGMSAKANRPKSDVYVPPKVAQMRFDVESDRKAVAFERAKKRAINSSIIAELKREFDVGPEEVSHSTHSSHNKINRFLKDKTVFEEEYMTRMSLTKKQRNEEKRIQSMNTMTSLSSGLTRFEDISALNVDNPNDFEFPNKKKRSSKSKNSKKFKRNKFSKSKK